MGRGSTATHHREGIATFHDLRAKVAAQGCTNYDARFWHSNGVGGTDEVDFGNWEAGMAKGGVAKFDAAAYHVWQRMYRTDDTFSCYVDGHEV